MLGLPWDTSKLLGFPVIYWDPKVALERGLGPVLGLPWDPSKLLGFPVIYWESQ